MAFLDVGRDSELNILYIAEVDKAFQHVVRWLRDKNTTQYLENHPAARDALVTAVQDVTRPKLLPTPAPTPSNPDTPSEQASTPLSSRDAEEYSPSASPHIAQGGNSSLDHLNNLWQTPSRAIHPQSPTAIRQEVEDGSQPYTSVEHTELLGGERVTGDYQHSANFEILPPAEHGDGSCNDDPSFIQPFQNTTQCQPRKRKHSFKGSDSPRSISFDGADVADDELGDRNPLCHGHLECQATRVPLPSSELSSADEEECSDRFMELSAALRAKVHMIGSTETLVTVEDYINYTATPPSFADKCANVSEGDSSPDTISASDQRLRVLKDCIVRDEAVEKSLKYLRIAVRISKRAALAELIGKYIQERDARTAIPKKRRKQELPQLSLKDHFTDLLFPETKRIEEQGKEREVARKAAKRKVSYWISLGEPLARMAQRFGYSVLLLLPPKLTDKELYHLPRRQIQVFLDYIHSIHPGLKEQASKLSNVLPYRIDVNSVLDKDISNLLPELRSRKADELLQLANGSDIIDPSIDQTPAIPRPRGTTKHGQGVIGDSFKSPQSPLVENGNSSSSTTNTNFSQGKTNYLEEPDQADRHQESPSSSQNDHGSAQRSGHTWGSPESEDYYAEDVDWRAEPEPSDNEGNDPDFPCSNLDESSYEELFDWSSYNALSS